MHLSTETVIHPGLIHTPSPVPAGSTQSASGSFANAFSSARSAVPAISESTRFIERTEMRKHWLEQARANPEKGGEIAHSYAFNYLAHALLDLSDMPNIRYSGTGELVTPENEARFAKISRSMQEQCASIYRQEIRMSTPADQILAKIFEFHDSMPKDFKDMLGM
jgi:hypothetical protein